MKLVIDISEEEYNLIKIKSESNIGGVSSEAERVIAKGTPLPKGHGRLIDANELIKWLKLYNERYNKRFAKTPIKDIPMYDLGHRNRNDDVLSIIDRFSTIIEADKEN